MKISQTQNLSMCRKTFCLITFRSNKCNSIIFKTEEKMIQHKISSVLPWKLFHQVLPNCTHVQLMFWQMMHQQICQLVIIMIFLCLYSGTMSNIFYQNATKKCCILIATELIRGPYARDFIKNIAIFSDNKRSCFCNKIFQLYMFSLVNKTELKK